MMAVSEEVRWYVAQIKTNGFDRAVSNLTRRGFSDIHAHAKKDRAPCTAIEKCSASSFPGYLFIQFGA